MSTIKIDCIDFGTDICSTCVTIQLINFRNEIKEQWNRYSNDGKTGIVYIKFIPSSKLLWEEPITEVGGTTFCITHYFNRLNSEVEQAQKPALIKDAGSFLKPA